MKILHKIEKFPSQVQERRFGLHLTDMNIQEYENLRSLLHTIFKYGQFNNCEDLAKQSGAMHSLSNVSVYDSNRIQDFNI